MADLWIYLITFLASLLTLLTGFGLGTILTPVFALVYDVKLAVLLVAIVHFLNNAFKFTLFRAHVELAIIKRFGVMSIVGALIGALLQLYLYSEVLKVVLGIVLIALGASEFFPAGLRFQIPKKVDVLGGLFSGLLGGLVGNQGAIRSAYLLNYAISKEAFIATATVIALAIDSARIPIYLFSQEEFLSKVPLQLVIVVLIAFLGTFIGKKILRQVSGDLFKRLIAGFVVVMGILFVFKIV